MLAIIQAMEIEASITSVESCYIPIADVAMPKAEIKEDSLY